MKKLLDFLRKISVITLVLIMVVGSVDTIAFAATDNNENTIYFEDTCVNPVYWTDIPEIRVENAEEVIGGNYEAALKYDAGDREANMIREAAVKVRDNMIARIENFTLVLKTDKKDFNSLVAEIFKMAVSEDLANSPVAGDYIAWQYGGYSYSGSAKIVDGLYEYTFNFRVPYYTTAYQEEKVTEAVKNALNELNIDELDEHDKVLNIYDYICRVCNYNYDTSTSTRTKFSAYGAIVEGSAVCQGYSTLLYRMLKEAGIDNKIVTSTNHSWNIVKLDGNYYNVDVTWDDNYYDKGLTYKYFLRCDYHFEDHIREPEYTTVIFNKRHNMADVCYYDANPMRERKMEAEPVVKCQKHQSVLVDYVPATCVNPGYKLYVCKVCGAENRVDEAVKGHKTVVDKAVPATYAKAGKTEGKHCATCKMVIVAQKAVPKLTVKAINLKNVTSKSKGFKITWNKQDKATGYQIQYSTSAKFTSGTTKTVNIKKNGTTTKTINKLKGKKKYYIRMRAYKNDNGKVYYSSWSNVKNVTTKK